MKKQTGQKEIIKKVLEYIRPQWFRVLLSLLMAVISVALTLYLPVLTGRRCVDGRRAGARDLFVRFIVSYLLKRQTVFARSCKARGHYYILYTKGAGISTLFMAAPRFLRFCSSFS